MRGPWSRPAAEKDINADGQVDQADHPQAQRHAAVHWLGNDHHGSVEPDAVAGDRVAGVAVDSGAVELALQVGQTLDGGVVDRGEQVVRLNAGALAGAAGQNLVGRQAAARRLAPPDAVIRLLEMALLLEVAHRQQHQAERNHGQQRRLQSVEETAFH